MKQIALKPIQIPLPRNLDKKVVLAIQKAEESMRENNALIEHTLNEIIKEINNANVSE